MWNHIESCEFTQKIKDGNDQIIHDHTLDANLKGFCLMTSVTLIEEHGGTLLKPRFRFRGDDLRNSLLISQDIPLIGNNPQTFMLPMWTRDSLLELSGPFHFEIIVSSRGTSIVKCVMSLMISFTTNIRRLHIPEHLITQRNMMNTNKQQLGVGSETNKQQLGVGSETNKKKNGIPRLRRHKKLPENTDPSSVTANPYFITDDNISTKCEVEENQTNIIPLYRNPNRRSISDLSPGQSVVA